MSRHIRISPRRLVTLPLLLAFTVAVFSFSAAQQSKTQPLLRYDLQTETKIKGTIQELKLPESQSKRAATELELKSDTGLVEVYLCPKAFLTDMGVNLDKGDEIQVTGSKIKQANGELFLARE